MKTLRRIAGAVVLALAPVAALADTGSPAGSQTAGGLGEAAAKAQQAGGIAYGQAATSQSLEQIVGGIVQNVLALMGVLFLVLAVYGGYTWMMARGNEKEVEKAKDTLKAAVIGVGIVLGAYAITSFVINRLIGATTGIVTQ